MMICDVCEKGEIKNYADGTCHCNNKNCLMDYTPPVYGRGDLRKREPLTGFPWLIYFLKCVWEVKPALIAVTGYILAFIFVVMLVWMATNLH